MKVVNELTSALSFVSLGCSMVITVVVKLEGGTEDDIAALKSEKIDDESVLELKKLKRFVYQKVCGAIQLLNLANLSNIAVNDSCIC